MPKPTSQSFLTHKRYVPGFHFVAGTLVVVNLLTCLVVILRGFTLAHLGLLLSAVILGQLFWYTRQFPLRVQDRLVCLEERLRLTQLLPADLRTRVPDLVPSQLIALRFASDAEVPALVRRVLDERLLDRNAIKALITSWRPDFDRA
jgi:hypothetical protein